MTITTTRCDLCGHAPHPLLRCLNMASDSDCSCDLRPKLNTAESKVSTHERLLGIISEARRIQTPEHPNASTDQEVLHAILSAIEADQEWEYAVERYDGKLVNNGSYRILQTHRRRKAGPWMRVEAIVPVGGE